MDERNWAIVWFDPFYRLLGEHGIAEDTAEARREFERRMEVRRKEEGDAEQ